MQDDDPQRTDKAINLFLRGKPEPLAEVIESNEIAALFLRLRENQALRAALANVLRGKSIRNRGRPKKDHVTVRDRKLLDQICYWCGYGVPLWQVESEHTACHYALQDVANMNIHEPRLQAETIYRQVWKERKALVGFFDEVAMATCYVEGIKAAHLNPDEILQRLQWAEKHQIRIDHLPPRRLLKPLLEVDK